MRLDEITKLNETRFTANGNMTNAASALRMIRGYIADASEEMTGQDWSRFAAMPDTGIMDLLIKHDGNVDKVISVMSDSFYDEHGQPLVAEAKPTGNLKKGKATQIMAKAIQYGKDMEDRKAPAGSTPPPGPQPKKKH